MIRFGPILADAGKGALHGALGGLNGSFLQQLGSGHVTIDNDGLQNLQVTIDNNNKLQNMINIGDLLTDEGKANLTNILDKVNSSFLQNMQVNSVISNGF